MGGIVGRPKKFQREIERHRVLYEGRDLRRVRNNWVLYWRFLAHLTTIGYRPRTIESYYTRVGKFIRRLGGKSLRRVRKSDVEQYLDYHKRNRQQVAYTVRYERQALAMFFRWMMGFCHMKVNPAMGLRMRMYYHQPEKMDLFSKEETVAIVQAPLRALERIRIAYFPTEWRRQEMRYRLTMHHLLMKLLFSTGMRPCEITGLEVDDFDAQALRLRVRNKGRQQYIVTDRHVFISLRTAEQLGELLRQSQAVRGADSRGRLFVHYRGGSPLAVNLLNHVVKKWAGECGIARNVYAYMTRYTYCTRLVEGGADLYSLRKLMGHVQPAVTLKHYLKLTPTEIRKEWKQFNPLAEGTT